MCVFLYTFLNLCSSWIANARNYLATDNARIFICENQMFRSSWQPIKWKSARFTSFFGIQSVSSDSNNYSSEDIVIRNYFKLEKHLTNKDYDLPSSIKICQFGQQHMMQGQSHQSAWKKHKLHIACGLWVSQIRTCYKPGWSRSATHLTHLSQV